MLEQCSLLSSLLEAPRKYWEYQVALVETEK